MCVYIWEVYLLYLGTTLNLVIVMAVLQESICKSRVVTLEDEIPFRLKQNWCLIKKDKFLQYIYLSISYMGKYFP